MIYRKVVLPLCRPALAALAVLEFTFIYNDFFWAVVLMATGSKLPDHLGPQQPPGRSSSPTTTCSPPVSFIVAVPTLVVYFVLSRSSSSAA